VGHILEVKETLFGDGTTGNLGFAESLKLSAKVLPSVALDT
jgi:hypothetical protein